MALALEPTCLRLFQSLQTNSTTFLIIDHITLLRYFYNWLSLRNLIWMDHPTNNEERHEYSKNHVVKHYSRCLLKRSVIA